jgi:hypothetical protein
MPVITDNDLKKYVDEQDIKIIRKGNIKHYGNGLYLPGSKGRGVYLNSEGEGFIDTLMSIGKTIANNIGLIKDVGQAVGSVAQAGTEVANLVKKSKEAANVGSQEEEDLTEHFNQLRKGRKKGEGFLFSK